MQKEVRQQASMKNGLRYDFSARVTAENSQRINPFSPITPALSPLRAEGDSFIEETRLFISMLVIKNELFGVEQRPEDVGEHLLLVFAVLEKSFQFGEFV